MKPLLLTLLSLFITHLAVGGELLTHTIYVSADGIDDSSCLNGDNHCKTLGYVLTNIPMLQCSNCTVMVMYDHVVGLFNGSTPYINISNVEVLFIVGLGQPNLYFNGSGLILANTDDTTSVVISNVIIVDCSSYLAKSCIDTTFDVLYNVVFIDYFLLDFNMTNVTFRHSTSVQVTARNVYSENTVFCDSDSFISLLVITCTSDKGTCNVMMLNNTFRSVGSIKLLCLGSVSSFLLVVEHSRFINLSYTAITIQPYKPISISTLSTITVNFSNCCWSDSVGSLFDIDLSQNIGFGGSINGSIMICDSNVTNNKFNKGISAVQRGNYFKNNVRFRCTGNSFTQNHGEILNLYNWPSIEIGNSLFVNNTATDGYIVSIQYHHKDTMNLSIRDLLFVNNSIAHLTKADRSGILFLKSNTLNSHLAFISCLNFSCNRGTPLVLVGIEAYITHTMVFRDNNAITGGGMYIGDGSSYHDATVLYIQHNASIIFARNLASYGGALYIDQDYCFVYNFNGYDGSFVFLHNRASYGPVIYSSYSWCNASCEAMRDATNIVSLPAIMSFNNNNTISIFPGQMITADMTVIDCFGNASSCQADVYMLCNKQVCVDYALQGPSTIVISNGLINTGLKLTTNSDSQGVFYDSQLQLMLACKSPTKELNLDIVVDIFMLNCPLGFVFSNSTGQCECAIDNEYFFCLKSAGVSCVREGYWYSSLSFTATECVHVFCDFSKRRKTCPSIASANSASYLLLGSTQDDQCLDGHGGTLCTGCAHNKLPTYGVLQCVDSDRCASWHPYVLLLLNIIIPFVDGVFFIIVVRLKLSIGSGYLYGPLFYLAVLHLIPLTPYSTLTTTVSSFSATLLLQLKALGYVPWCFYSSFTRLDSRWLELIAPSVVGVVLLLTVYLARCSPKLFGQTSPLQAMCLLMYVSFWSLASTAISVIIPVYLSGVEGVRVHLEPDLPYLSGGHIPLWIISVIILLVLGSIVLILMFSHALNLHRLKPIFDEFQSCYRDSYRWYGGIYFIIWSILLILVVTSNYHIFKMLLIVLAVTHCLLQPYCKKWLNVMDGFFLGSLTATSCLVLGESSPYLSTSTVTAVLVYASVMGPLCVISLGIMSIVLVWLGVLPRMMVIVEKKFREKKPRGKPVPHPDSNVTQCVIGIDNSSSDDREPLLYHIQDSDDYGATDNN